MLIKVLDQANASITVARIRHLVQDLQDEQISPLSTSSSRDFVQKTLSLARYTQKASKYVLFHPVQSLVSY